MAVKDKVIDWVHTNKGAPDEDGHYPTFRASDVAADIETNITNVRSALSTLKGEGVVENPEWGLYRFTENGTVKPAKKRAAKKKEQPAQTDPLQDAAEHLKHSLESVLYQIERNDETLSELTDKMHEVQIRSEELAAEAEKIKTAYHALTLEE